MRTWHGRRSRPQACEGGAFLEDVALGPAGYGGPCPGRHGLCAISVSAYDPGSMLTGLDPLALTLETFFVLVQPDAALSGVVG